MKELYEEITELIVQEKYDQAQEKLADLLNQLIKRGSKEDFAQLGYNFQQLGFIPYAKAIYQEAAKRYPGEATWPLLLGELAMDDGRYEEGLDYLLSIDPNDDLYLEALLLEADAYQMLSLPEVSLAKLKEANQLAPGQEAIEFGMAQLVFTMGDFKEALKLYHDLSQKEDLSPEIREEVTDNYQYALVATGQYDKAAQLLSNKENSALSQAEKEQLAFLAYHDEDYSYCDQLLSPLYENNLLDPSYYLLLAKCKWELHESDQALRVINEAISKDPYASVLYMERANFYFYLKEFKRAQADYEKVLEADEDNIRAYQQLLRLALDSDNEDRAQELIEAMKDKGISDGNSHWLMAQFYNQTENYDQARKYYDLASRDLKDDNDFLVDYIYFLREEGQFRKIITLLADKPELKQSPALSSVIDQVKDWEQEL